jgi:hypothetical protein
MDPLLEVKSMDGLSAEDQAKQAIVHVLRQIYRNEKLRHIMGAGSESFNLLTEAFSTLTKRDLVELRKETLGWKD